MGDERAEGGSACGRGERVARTLVWQGTDAPAAGPARRRPRCAADLCTGAGALAQGGRGRRRACGAAPKGLVFFAALVALVPITVCGDAASSTRAASHAKVAGGIRREVSHVDMHEASGTPVQHRHGMTVPRREVSHADMNDAKASKLELRSGSSGGVGSSKSSRDGQSRVGGETENDDTEWQSQIVYSGEVLGVGSFSVVHAARNVSSGQPLAVKIVRIPPDNAIFIKRLTREVKILREIDHPNIVPLVKVLESLDTDNSGSISPDEFVEALTAVADIGKREHVSV